MIFPNFSYDLSYNGLLNVMHTAYSLNINWPTELQPVVRFFNVIALLLIVSLLAYFTTRLVGSAKLGRANRRNLEIVESIAVGSQAYVHMLRVGGKFILVGVTKGQVNMLTPLDESDLKFREISQMPTFESFLKRFPKKDNQAELPDDRKDNNP